jgi:hypothetical protein
MQPEPIHRKSWPVGAPASFLYFRRALRTLCFPKNPKAEEIKSKSKLLAFSAL